MKAPGNMAETMTFVADVRLEHTDEVGRALIAF